MQFKGTSVPNHSFVSRGELSRPTDNPLLCVTPDNTTCCSTTETGGSAPLGNWYFPNGTEIPPDSTGWNFSITRGPGVVQLHRHTGGVSGIYRCVIPDLSGVNQTLYVGLYAISNITSGEQMRCIALYMSDGKHYPCFVPMSYLWSSVDQDFLLASKFFKNHVFKAFVFFNSCLFYSA